MSVDIEVERAKFEEWVRGLGYGAKAIRRDNRGKYSADCIDDAWDGWIAAKRDAAQTKYVPEVKS